MRNLPRNVLIALAATIGTKLELANGGPLWDPVDIEAYKAKRQNAEPKRPLWSRLAFPFLTPRWHTNLLYNNGRDEVYQRDYRTHKAPSFVGERVKAIREFFPKARFMVSFFGTDPILVVQIEEDGKDFTFFPVVWDEVDGNDIIVPPPA